MKTNDSVTSALVDEAVALARKLQERATDLQTASERRQQRELDRMLQRPGDKATLVKMTDEAFRSSAAARTADHLTHILDVQGIPRFFSPVDRALLRGFKTFGGWLPTVSVPLVKEHMQQETTNVVLPAETALLREHLAARQKEGLRMNLNLLGEAVLGEAEAAKRLEAVLESLQMPEVEVVSVKISTIYSQISALAREQTLQVLCERLEVLYRTAARLRFQKGDGTEVPKFVYLDMEEYRDLHLTAQAFMRTLDRPGLEQVHAGIALQAYIPDSAAVQRDINAWARKRVAQGGAPVTIRLVKGANMEAERVDAALHGWPQAPFLEKVETDANYKRMLYEGMRNLHAVRLGIASHNLFDVAYGLTLASRESAPGQVQFEMLEGMASHQRRALREQTGQMLLYAPACRKEEFLNAIGYLLRRLDENTGPENFLRHAFKLTPGSSEWDELERGFRDSFRGPVQDIPRRRQDRSTETHPHPKPEMAWDRFHNEPDTDWSLLQNSKWAEELVRRRDFPAQIPLVIGGSEILLEDRLTGRCLDPSRPGTELARYMQAGSLEINLALECATNDPAHWRSRSLDERSAILGKVAQEIRRHRGELMRAAMAEGGKILSESDPEVSEAVDFVEFYRASARVFYNLPGLRAAPRGVVVVVPPWNFPIAIPCGGIAAALAAGNTVIMKPASHTVMVAFILCQCFWRAGVPKESLQFAPCAGSGAAQDLVTDPRVNAVILTGGTATAKHLLEVKPDLPLFAETGGKNATVITALSDRELAIKHVVHSAFSHGGQKCSATSLLLLEAEVYDDPRFQEMLRDAVKSLAIGSAWELQSRVAPLIRPPGGDLENGLKVLEPGESWLVRPEPSPDNPHLWSPGVKYGVQPGSYTHRTEFFGPVLGVMRYERLEQAISLVNQTGYGLTSGLHSLDDREHHLWQDHVQAGNLYINRGTTGAVVLRQPFGGMGKSCFGPGMKAGGPNYIAQFLRFKDTTELPVPESPVANEDLEQVRRLIFDIYSGSPAGLRGEEARFIRPFAGRLLQALESYDDWWNEEFALSHDHFRLLGQDNFRRYLPFKEIHIRTAPGDDLFDIFARAFAARVTGARSVVSIPEGEPAPAIALLERFTESWGGAIEFVQESDEDLISAIRARPAHARERIRYAAPERVPRNVREAAAESGQYIADQPVLAHGRVELLWYLREQSISYDYHRYGNLGARSIEARQVETPADA